MYTNVELTDRCGSQLSTLGLVWPSLLLTYLGQAAFLIKHPEAIGAAYYASVPHPVFWPMFIIAVLAAVIASQVQRWLATCLI
jgi:KUP system potassium uptake protein